MTYLSTVLVADNSPEEIRKADLSLLEKINKLSESFTTAATTKTTVAETETSSELGKAKLVARSMYTGNGVRKPSGEVVTFGQKTGNSACALLNGLPTTEGTYSSPFYLNKPAGETGILIDIDMWMHGGCALYSSGNFYTCGYNVSGGLGLGNLVSQSILTLAATNVTEYRKPTNLCISGNNYRIWIKKTDKLWYVAGYNGTGACGVGSTTDQLSFVHPTSMGTDVKELWNFGGTYGCTLFITYTNHLYVAGYNGSGQFGNGNTATLTSFTDITSFWKILPQDKIKITGEFGYYDTSENGSGEIYISIKKEGQQGYTVWVSGAGAWGGIGDGTTTTISTPKKILNLPENIDNLITQGGSLVSCYAYSTDGKLYVWGYNGNGQLGVGSTVQQNSIREISIPNEQITDIFAACHNYSYPYVCQAFLQTKSGKIYCTGANNYGQCGDGTFTNILAWKNIPFDTTMYGRIVDVSWNGYDNGGGYIVALTEKGKFFAVGYNGRHGISLTGETVNKSIFTQLLI